MMGITKGDAVLDVGCGTGRQAVNVSGIIGSSGRFTGIDPSSNRIKLAQEKFTEDSKNNVRFLVGQAENLRSIPDHSIDHAYFCSSFHWVEDKKLALSEIFRVLNPDGRVGMTTVDRNSPRIMRGIVNSILEKYHVKRDHEQQRNITRVTSSELHTLLLDAGFTDIIIEPRAIPRHYGSPEDVMNHLMVQGGPDYLLKGIPGDIKQKIMTDINRELKTRQAPDGIGFGNITLFAIATKPTQR
jgi:ubiquinone/menaquinone biosynthesis C-methylase UbiE